MAGSLTTPNTFANQSGNVPAIQLDQNWAAHRDYVNTREVTVGTLGGRPAPSVSGRYYFATDTATFFLDTGTQWLAVGAPSGHGVWAIRRANGANNAVTPLTQYDIACDAVQLRNPITGQTMSFMNPGTRTNDILLAGPVVNGRDQAGAFSANSDVHLYYITDGTTLSTIMSIAAPSAGPVLPGGYHSWAYITALRLNASTQFLSTVLRGSRVTYVAPQFVLVSGASTVTAAVNVASMVPATALEYEINEHGWTLTADGGGNLAGDLEINIVSGVIYGFLARPSLSGLVPSSPTRTNMSGSMTLPNIGQQLFYRWVLVAGTAPSINLYVSSYRVANGGD